MSEEKTEALSKYKSMQDQMKKVKKDNSDLQERIGKLTENESRQSEAN